MARLQPLLSHFRFVDTTDRYVARKKHARLWGRFTSRTVGRAKYRLLHNLVHLNQSSLHYLECSANVSVQSELRHERYWLQVPLSGYLEININGQEVTADATRAVVQGPWRQYRFRTTPTRALFFGLDATLVDAVLPEGFRGRHAYVLEGVYRNLLAKLLVGFAETLDEWAASAAEGAAIPAFARHLEVAIGSCVADGIRSGRAQGSVIGGVPITVIRELMAQRLREDLSVKDLAAAAGVGVRTLQKGFAEYYGVSPLHMLKTMRLDRARELMRASVRDIRVGDVCREVGHGHAGRFSAEYAARFGETPSETLQRRAAEH